MLIFCAQFHTNSAWTARQPAQGFCSQVQHIQLYTSLRSTQGFQSRLSATTVKFLMSRRSFSWQVPYPPSEVCCNPFRTPWQSKGHFSNFIHQIFKFTCDEWARFQPSPEGLFPIHRGSHTHDTCKDLVPLGFPDYFVQACTIRKYEIESSIP